MTGSVPGRVSFIVPTRNSARTIAACLSSVRGQTYGDVELIVVDNSSTDGTSDIASDLADRLISAGPERSAQRNIGARQSTGEFLIFLDSDMVVPPTLAQDVVAEFARDAGVQALVIPERAVGEGFWARCRSLEKDLYVGAADVEAARAFRRTAFESAGGYDERIHGGGEDWDLPERIAAGGGGIGRTTAEVVHDEGALALREDLGQKFYYGRTFGRYIRKRPDRAARKFFRIGFVRNSRLLVRDPVVAGGLVVLKTLELGAVLAGVGFAFISRHPAESRTTA